MITALQNFISKQSKFLFPILLLVIVVSFVLYLSQGSSVFDLIPDPTREKKELYGVDLNDPDQRRVVSMSNRVAADFGVMISPSEEVMEKADQMFMQNLQNQIQAAFRANQENIDRNALQQMFGFMQQWPNLPRSVKLREIARSGLYDFEFSESSSQAKITLDGLADSWSFLPMSINHPKVTYRFDQFLRLFNPEISSDENRTRALLAVGRRHGFSPTDTEIILYSHFRAAQVDRTYGDGGVALALEGELDLHGEQFAWDAEIISLTIEDLNISDPVLFTVKFDANPEIGDSLSLAYASKNLEFEFSDQPKDRNGSRRFIEVGESAEQSMKNLLSSIKSEDLGFSFSNSDFSFDATPIRASIPSSQPKISTASKQIVVKKNLDDALVTFHAQNKEELQFAEPSLTFATALTFASEDYLVLPPPPDEARMLSYFERNRDLFVPPVPVIPDNNETGSLEGAEGPEGPLESNSSDSNKSLPAATELSSVLSGSGDFNSSVVKELTFEDVRDEVRQRIIDGDRIDAERYAETGARDAAIDFLDEINGLQDLLRNKYSAYADLRKSTELTELLAKHKAKSQSFKFSAQDMAMQGAILGLETRESERRLNKQPLEEVQALDEKSFFTRSVRKSRSGYVVFLFDKSVESGPGKYENASFKDLYQGYADQFKGDALLKRADQLFADLNESKDLATNKFLSVKLQRKGASSVRTAFDKQGDSLSRELSEFQNERNLISDAEREGNATSAQLENKESLDRKIEEIRNQQSVLNRKRSLAVRLIDSCSSLDQNAKWEELERTDGEVLFARRLGVYSILPKEQASEKVDQRVAELEFSRAEKARGHLVQNLIDRQLNR